MKSTLRNTFAATLIFMLQAACSNPFSKQKPAQIQQTKSASCGKIDFHSETIDPTQLRNMLDCLNSGHQIEGFKKVLDHVSDAELTPIINAFNETSQNNPQLFFALKEFYLHLKKNRSTEEFNWFFDALFNNAEQNEVIASVIQRHSMEFAKLIFNPGINVNLKSLYLLTKSDSYRRIVKENNTAQFWKNFISSAQRYQGDASSLPLSKIVPKIFSTTFFERLRKISDRGGENELRKLSSTIEWFFSNQRIKDFSSQLRSFQNASVSCMNGNIPLERPDLYLAHKISTLSAQEAKKYLQQDAKSLMFIGQAFCDIPSNYEDFTKLLSELADQPGFNSFFELFGSLLVDEHMLNWLSSPAFEVFVGRNSGLAETHFFYDAVTLLAQFSKEPIFENGSNTILDGVDYALKNYNEKELTLIIQFLQPLFSEKQDYGNRFISFVHREFSNLPSFPKKSLKVKREDLEHSISSILKSDYIADAFNTFNEIAQKRIINSLLDDLTSLFSIYISRGSHQITFSSAERPNFPLNQEQAFLLEKYFYLSVKDFCTNLPFTFVPERVEEYFACFDPDTTLPKTQIFGKLTLDKKYLSILADWKNTLSSSNLSTHLPAFYDVAKDFFLLPTAAIQKLSSAMQLSSTAVQQFLNSLTSSVDFKKFLGQIFTSNETFETIDELLKKDLSQYSKNKADPFINLLELKKIDLRLDSDEYYQGISFRSAVQKTMDRFCPNRDVRSAKCDIDTDQVELFLRSPDLLVEQIKNEYLNNASNWIHPKSFPKKWNHVSTPTITSDFELHFYPLLHLIQGNPKAVQSTVDFLNYFHLKKDEQVSSEHHFPPSRFLDFIISKSTHLTMMPYIYQLNRDPNSKSQEYHDRIRIRLVSDLGQIELMAINTDFIFIPAKYPMIESILQNFGIVLGNTGMRLASEVGFAMGDLPREAWPKDLGKFKELRVCDPKDKNGGDRCVRTYDQVKQMMYQQIELFDTVVLRTLGNCDQRSALRSATCHQEFYDVNARVFNLKRLLRFMDNGGGDVIRDIFYTTHTSSAPGELGHYPDGMKLDPACRKNPTLVNSSKCLYDNLELATVISRLGLLHEIALSVLQNKDSSFLSLAKILLQIQERSSGLTEKIVSHLSSREGVRLALEISDAAFQLQRTYTRSEKDALATFVEQALMTSTYMKDHQWAEFILLIVKNNPKIFYENLELVKDLTTLANPSKEESFSLPYYLMSNPSSVLQRWLDLVSSKLKPELVTELSQSLPSIRERRNEWLPPLRQMNSISFSNSWDALRPSASRLFSQLARYPVDFDRAKFSDQFCTVFSDAEWVSHAMDSLEEIHQNPNTRILIDDVGKMLNLSH